MRASDLCGNCHDGDVLAKKATDGGLTEYVSVVYEFFGFVECLVRASV